MDQIAGLGSTASDRLHSLLFEQGDRRLRNIKFFRGPKSVVSVSELEDAVHAAILSTRSGRVSTMSEFRDVEQTPVDVRELVKNL